MTERRPAALIWVQHLHGTGHLVRAGRIAAALAEAGWDAHLASGGPAKDLAAGVPARPGLTLHQLPPLTTDGRDFSRFLTPDGAPATDAILASRAAALLGLFHRIGPDVLLTEHFPFGRRAHRFELMPLLQAARTRTRAPVVAASVRDILVGRKPERHAEAGAIIKRCYDRVLVHGDPRVVAFGDSFPMADQIDDMLDYTGYVGAAAAPGRAAYGQGEVVVSTGGGAAGAALTEAALDAAARTEARRWRILIGKRVAEQDFVRFRETAPPNAVVERARPDFPDLLAQAAVSVSQAGYNTSLDILGARCPAVLIPYAPTPSESEQTVRAAKFEQAGLAITVAEQTLTGPALAEAVGRAMGLRPPETAWRLDGERESVRLLTEALAARRSPAVAGP